jgi:hypothetical protein
MKMPRETVEAAVSAADFVKWQVARLPLQCSIEKK